MSITGGRLVVKALKRLGIRHLFSLPGHQILSVYDACIDEEMDLISTRHEASAVFMAQALSFVNRTPGVALLAGGPELTNALTGIAQAFYAKTPLLIISGTNTLKKKDRGFPQDMDQLEVVRPFTKWARSCHDVRRIPEYISSAYRNAIRGRPGPVYVEIPYDVMESRTALSKVFFPGSPPRLRSSGEKCQIEKMTTMLQESRRPIAIAGSGVLWSGAESELMNFIERTGIPLFLTTAALSVPFPSGKVTGLGSMGVGRPSLEAISRADLILLLGTRINFLLGFGQPPFISLRQKIIQIDVQAEEIDSNRQVDLGIAGDLRTILQALNRIEWPATGLQTWGEKLRKSRDEFRATLLHLAETSSVPMHPLRLVRELEDQRTDNSFLVLDGANSILWALMLAGPRPGGGIVVSTLGELEAIGAGVPQALAIKRMFPERQVILHTGDGSLGYGFMEFETAIRYNIPLVVVVHNDSGWGMTRDMQQEFFGKNRELGNRLGVVRYDQMVEALGGHGEFVEMPEDLKPALDRALNAGVPACVNVMVDPKPRSPGLMMFMMLEVMLGKDTYFDRIPGWMRKLRSLGLDRFVSKAMLRTLDRKLHKNMK